MDNGRLHPGLGFFGRRFLQPFNHPAAALGHFGGGGPNQVFIHIFLELCNLGLLGLVELLLPGVALVPQLDIPGIIPRKN